MKLLLIRAAMVFFATLLAAALVALGAPLLVDLLSRVEALPHAMATAHMPASIRSPAGEGAIALRAGS